MPTARHRNGHPFGSESVFHSWAGAPWPSGWTSTTPATSGPPARTRHGGGNPLEPGIYLPDENIGVRIEDDVLITPTGYQLLTARAAADGPTRLPSHYGRSQSRAAPVIQGE